MPQDATAPSGLAAQSCSLSLRGTPDLMWPSCPSGEGPVSLLWRARWPADGEPDASSSLNEGPRGPGRAGWEKSHLRACGSVVRPRSFLGPKEMGSSVGGGGAGTEVREGMSGETSHDPGGFISSSHLSPLFPKAREPCGSLPHIHCSLDGWMDGFIHSFTHQYMVIEYYYVPGTPLNTSNTGISKTVAVPILME